MCNLCFLYHSNVPCKLCKTVPLLKQKQLNLCFTLYISFLSIKHSDMTMCSKGDHTVLPATHTPTIPAFTAQPQGDTALSLVLIALTNEGMARLS